MRHSARYFAGACLGLLLVAPPATAAQSCRADIPASSPASDFQLSGATATDQTTGLMWLRCPAGQAWDTNACTGSAQLYDWQEALQYADGITEAGHSDWRLPNKNELASIVEVSCYLPSIDLAVFPGLPEKAFWTSSPSNEFSSHAWVISMDQGVINNAFKTGAAHVLLVRDAP